MWRSPRLLVAALMTCHMFSPHACSCVLQAGFSHLCDLSEVIGREHDTTQKRSVSVGWWVKAKYEVQDRIMKVLMRQR